MHTLSDCLCLAPALFLGLIPCSQPCLLLTWPSPARPHLPFHLVFSVCFPFLMTHFPLASMRIIVLWCSNCRFYSLSAVTCLLYILENKCCSLKFSICCLCASVGSRFEPVTKHLWKIGSIFVVRREKSGLEVGGGVRPYKIHQWQLCHRISKRWVGEGKWVYSQ